MKAGDRWTRMGELVNIDLEKFRVQVADFERDLAASQNQLQQLKEYCVQNEKLVSQPNEYSSITQLTRQHHFIDSLRTAIGQQQKLVFDKTKRVEQMKQHLFELFKTKESYNSIAEAQNKLAEEKQEKAETEFLDDLATQGFVRNSDPYTDD